MPEPNQELVQAWKENAIMRNPGSEKLAEMVSGSTKDEIEDSARRAAAIVADIASTSSSDTTFERARQAYGPGPTTGGIAEVPTPYVSPETRETRWQMDFKDRFNNAPRNSYNERLGISNADITRYTTGRFVEQVIGKLNQWATMTRSDAGYRRPGPR